MVRVSLVLLFFVFLMSSCGGDSGDNLRREDNRIEILSEKLELLEQEKNDFYQFWFMPQAILSLGIIVYDTTFMIQLLEDPEEDKTQDDIWYHLYSLYMERNHELSWICFTLELLNAETKVKHDLLCLVSKRYKIEGAYVRSRKDIPVFLDMLKKDERWEEALQSTFRDDMPPLYILRKK